MDGFPEEEIFHYGRVTIQIAPDLLPAIPVRMGEVAAFAQILTHTEILAKIQQQGRFARARFGSYDLLDFVVVLTGSILSGEPTLLAFYERLAPWASPFMVLSGRNRLPHRSTLSRFLAALDRSAVEALRTSVLCRAMTPAIARLFVLVCVSTCARTPPSLTSGCQTKWN
ncbi:MAG TPA: hypothetical protein VKV40_04180 [Ktedonobacteraceae bacterium]|nr:hypothetical protein [Ktedonobacteraceae bacterium]